MIKLPFVIALFFLSTLIACNQQIRQEDIKEPATLNKLLTEQEGYVKVKMTEQKSGHLSLSTKVNNIKGRFILDTGSSTTIIDRKHRKKFRLITKSTEKIAKTAGGSQLKMKVSMDNTFQFNKLKLRNVRVSLVNLSHINYSFQKMGMSQVDGIIGSDLLKNRKAIIDYDNLVLYLKKNN